MKKQQKKLFMLFCAYLSIIGVHAETINKVEYWFDSGFGSRVQTSYSSNEVVIQDIITTSVNVGMHMVHYRAQDGAGNWSVVHSQVFYKIPLSLTGIELTDYEYWFDSDFSNRIIQTASTANLVLSDPIDVTSLSEEFHNFHVRVKDENGEWSVVHSQVFYKLPASLTGIQLTDYEYWFDSDFSNRIIQTDSTANLVLSDPIDVTSLSEGIHNFHVRVKDENEKWSVVHSQVFYKLPASLTGIQLTNYEYWLDSDFSNRISQTVSTANLILSNPFDVSTLAEGIHNFHFRVKDENGKWSVVQSQIFYKSNISLVNNKIDAYRYWFDDNFLVVNNITLPEPINPYELIANLDVDESFSIGETHKISFQSRDVFGNWSIVETDTFSIPLYTNYNSISGEMNVYPNPFENFIVISGNNISGKCQVSIYNSSGVCILNKPIDFSIGSAKIEFPNKLLSGIYMIRIESEAIHKSFKVKRK